jgi:NAD(P)-dependent dehydrogenase (short-subunit alcohol dehydrogenase family)
VKLIDGPARGVGRQICLRFSDELVEPADDARVASARSQLRKIEEDAEADEQREQQSAADEDSLKCSERAGCDRRRTPDGRPRAG